jgi:hypothetical protein
MHAIRIAHTDEAPVTTQTLTPTTRRRVRVPAERPTRAGPGAEPITRQRVIAAEGLALWAMGRRMEDEDGEGLSMPASATEWTGRDQPPSRGTLSREELADVATLIRLGGDLLPSTVMAAVRFRAAAMAARTTVAERRLAEGLARRAARIAERGTAEASGMWEWPRPLSGCLAYYGWGRADGRSYAAGRPMAGEFPHAGRRSGFGRQMDTGSYGIRQCGADPLRERLVGEWREIAGVPTEGPAILLADRRWVDCAQHRAGHDVWSAVPVDGAALDQWENWRQLAAYAAEHGFERGPGDFGRELYWSPAPEAALDIDDAWGAAALAVPWLMMDGAVVDGVQGVGSHTPIR